MVGGGLPLDSAEIRHFVHCTTKGVKQAQTRGALGRVGVVYGDSFKEIVNRGTQGGQRGHGPGEVLRRDGGLGAGCGLAKGSDECGLGGFRFGVGGARFPADLALGLEDVSSAFVAG